MQSARFSIWENSNQVKLDYNGNLHCFKKSVGWKYLLEILRNPGRIYNARQLSSTFRKIPERYQYLARQSKTELESSNLYISPAEMRIAMIDDRGLKEVSKRLNVLIEIEAELRINNDLAALDDVLEEKEQLQQYLQEVLSYTGSIRSFSNSESKAAAAVSKAITRCLDSIHDVEPALAEYLSKHIEKSNRICFLPEV
ncbi:MAG: hypothetical protein M0Q99_12440 [Candidatus Cloacimonetes bacterium]|nr:hypothetical protein [Candidatus Cloacimonadota bacterium]